MCDVNETETLLCKSANNIHKESAKSVIKAEDEGTRIFDEYADMSNQYCCCCHEDVPAVTTSATTQTYCNTGTIRSTGSSNDSACSCASTQSSCLAGSERYVSTAETAAITADIVESDSSDNEAEHHMKLPLQYNSVPCISQTEQKQRNNNKIYQDEEILAYSFKGIPPEIYSAKKEFIYNRQLVPYKVGWFKSQVKNCSFFFFSFFLYFLCFLIFILNLKNKLP